MKKFVPALLFLVFPITTSAQNRTIDSQFHITGVVNKPSPRSMVYLLYQTEGRRIIDSSVIIDTHFEFKGMAPEPLFATLFLDHDGKGLKNAMSKLVDELDFLKFYLHKGELIVDGKDSITSAIFTKSAINKDYARLRALESSHADHLLNTLSAKMQRNKDAASEKRYVVYYDSLQSVRQPLLKRFAINNPTSYIALVALQEYAGAFPDVNEIAPIFNRLSSVIKNSKAGKDFNVLLKSSDELAVGKLAPDFSQADTTGQIVSLSSFKGKYVLIDFWASWCGPCRADNPKWIKVYENLKGKNFTILGVSLDGQDTRDAWRKAIKADGLSWTQVSDLKHWDNVVAKQFGINAIPQNILIAPDGRIAAKNIEPEVLQKLIEKSH